MPIPVQGRSIGLGHEREWHGAKGGKGEWVAVYFFCSYSSDDRILFPDVSTVARSKEPV